MATMRPNTSLMAVIFVAVVLLTCTTEALLVPPAIGYDAANGFRVWNSMSRGASVNRLRVVSRTNISQDADEFWAVVSPGQYMLPGLLMRAGLSLGRSVWLLTAILIPLSLSSYYYLYRKGFHFTRTISILSCLVILVSRQTLNFFLSYGGHTLLQFAGFPILLLACILCIRRSGMYLFLLPLLFLTGAFLKLSFAVIALSVVASVALEQLPLMRSKPMSSWIFRPFATLLAFVAFYITLHVFYTSKGWTAAQLHSGGTFLQFLFSFLYSTAAVMSGIVSMFWSLSHLGSPLQFVLLPDPIAQHWFPVVIALATVSVGLLVWTYLRSNNSSYRALLLGFVTVHVCTFTFLVVKGSVALEDRHFWPVSTILLPGLLAAIDQLKVGTWKNLAIVVFTAFAAYGMSSYVVNAKRAMNSGRSSSLGVTLLGRSQRLIDTIEGLDQQLNHGRNIFYFNDPALAMLIRHNPQTFETVMDPRNRVYVGTTDRVIMAVDRGGGKNAPVAGVTATFKSYDKWQWTVIDSTDFYYAGKDPLPLLNMLAAVN